MASNWKALQQEIDAENSRILESAPEDVLRIFKYEIIPTGAGTAGMTMGVWFEGATAGRYVGAYYVYNIIKIASDKDVSVTEINYLVQELLPKVVATSSLCGLEVLGRFSVEVMACLKEMTSKEDVISLLNSLYLYGSNMNAWIHHYMKWGISQAFIIPDKEACKEIGACADKCYK